MGTMNWTDLLKLTLDNDAVFQAETSVSGDVKKGGTTIYTLPRYKYTARIKLGGHTFAAVLEAVGARDLTVKTQAWLKAKTLEHGADWIPETYGISKAEEFTKTLDDGTVKKWTVYTLTDFVDVTLDDLLEKKERGPRKTKEEARKEAMAKVMRAWTLMTDEQRAAFPTMSEDEQADLINSLVP